MRRECSIKLSGHFWDFSCLQKARRFPLTSSTKWISKKSRKNFVLEVSALKFYSTGGPGDMCVTPLPIAVSDTMKVRRSLECTFVTTIRRLSEPGKDTSPLSSSVNYHGSLMMY